MALIKCYECSKQISDLAPHHELDGSYESYHENGQLREKRTYRGGKRDGPYECYHKDGETVNRDPCTPGPEDGN